MHIVCKYVTLDCMTRWLYCQHSHRNFNDMLRMRDYQSHWRKSNRYKLKCTIPWLRRVISVLKKINHLNWTSTRVKM